LANPFKVKSILGLLPDYTYVDIMLKDPRHENPSLTCGLYEIDDETTYQLKEAILVIRYAHFKTIKTWIEHCKVFLSVANHHWLVKEQDRIESRFAEELQKLGIDEENQKSMLNTIM